MADVSLRLVQKHTRNVLRVQKEHREQLQEAQSTVKTTATTGEATGGVDSKEDAKELDSKLRNEMTKALRRASRKTSRAGREFALKLAECDSYEALRSCLSKWASVEMST